MRNERIILTAPNGLHARPAKELVQIARSFPGTKVTLATDAKTVDAASILSVLSLGLKNGTQVLVGADGPDEEEALSAVVSLLSHLSE